MTAICVAALLAAALVLMWPNRSAARRLEFVSGRARPFAGPRLSLPAISARWVDAPRRTTLVMAALGAMIALLWQGPVAALCGGVYAALAAKAGLDRTIRRATEAERNRLESALAGLAADLRAGSSPSEAVVQAGLLNPAIAASPAALRTAARSSGDEPAARLAAAWQVAESTGAALATVLDRLETDLGATRRRRARTAAEAAGAATTSRLLALLPAVGVAMGYGLSADPLDVLLHTPVGAGCCVAAVLLQYAGLRWSRRIIEATGRMS
ncbi:type II secretion system F family protein [Fodinicola feengrottensis]|uniref:Type II secretion system protein n=1 Tax=Fodinicola feengrottensis TaxID=435914 RepID=A0ABN2FSV3_9ACTN|nr:type II secretion system F family protein [Fodinicola feengrottensis]